MAVPKRKVSQARGAKRRAHLALKAKQLGTCSRCSQRILPHTVCVYCGTYREEVVLKVSENDDLS
ncbi:MAG: 50S ribosomal protein L32 [Planctomycetota bacterium]|nr:50S ribosomal protein L32 [Planctomycetota bacterium]